ncbi:MAG: hypothetical protein IKF71_05385 [Bacilli bacterium]|nr:hypothetical protein [Bacilli bacterium]
MKEEVKGEESFMDQTRVYFNVYKQATGLYISEELCKQYHVGNQNDIKQIKDQTCYQVNEADLETIKMETQNSSKVLIPNIIKIFDLQLVLSFTVYVDINHNRILYISDNTCTKYGITPQSKRMINGTTFCQVTEDNLEEIENLSAREKVRLKRNYVEIELPDEMKPAEYLFVLYKDHESNKSYVTRDIYDLLKNSDLEIEGEPKIIDNKNCYSITENQLKDAEEALHYRSVEFLMRPSTNIYARMKEFPDKKDIEETIQKLYDIQKRMNLFAHAKTYDDSKVKDNIKPYIDRIMPVLGDDDIIKSVLNDEETIRKVLGDDDIIKSVLNDEDIVKKVLGDDDIIKEVIDKPTIVYRDTKTANLYIPTSREDATITILNKPCREINYEEIQSYAKEPIIANVYLTEKAEYKVIVCNNNGQLFVSHDMISKLGFYVENPHRIMVNKEIYEEIAPEDIDIIKELESNNCHIEIIMKQIAPKRG